jgi:hypothetical protein
METGINKIDIDIYCFDIKVFMERGEYLWAAQAAACLLIELAGVAGAKPTTVLRQYLKGERFK